MAEPVVVRSVPLPGTGARRIERRFYIGIAVLMIVLNAVAFAPPFFDQSVRREPLPLTPLVAAHAAVSIAWLFLFLIQASLIATRRIRVHRRLGAFGAVLSATFVVLGVLATIEEGRRGYDLSGNFGRLPPPPGIVDQRASDLGVLFFFFLFAVLAGAALWYRNRPAVHKRLMSLALLGGLTPTTVAHVIGSWLGPQPWAGLLFPVGMVVFLSMVLIHDRVTEGRVHPVSLWASVFVFASTTVFNAVIFRSNWWLRFSAWLVQ